MEKPEQNEPGALYVSSNPEVGPVTRYGLGITRGSFNYIGATRTAAPTPDDSSRASAKQAAKVIEYSPELIVKLPAAEVAQFKAEYDRAIASGALIVRKFDDYAKQQEAEAKHLKAEAEAEEKRLKDLAKKTKPAEVAGPGSA